VSLNLTDVRRIAGEVAHAQNPALEVIAARADHDSTYTEVFLTLPGCSAEPCTLIVGVSRDGSEVDFRAAIRERLADHLDGHLTSGTR
jgi:hypothetical protein